jgi:hypothetical protein
MDRIDCHKCEHYSKNKECSYSFRWASGAAGQAVDDIRDVYWCQDFSEISEDEYEKDNDC